jgi:hypothetical protein
MGLVLRERLKDLLKVEPFLFAVEIAIDYQMAKMLGAY